MIFTCFIDAAAQQNGITSSPYSIFGIGDPLELNNVMGLSMGDVKYAMDRPFYLNTANPASYASLRAATFSLGTELNRTHSFSSTTDQFNDNGALRYFALGIPLGKKNKLGMSFGAKPYTAVGYAIQPTTSSQDQLDAYTRYSGKGGVNILFGGLGYRLYSDSIHTLSFGSNVNFYYGNSNEEALNVFPLDPSALNSMRSSSYVTNGVGADFSLLYGVNLGEIFDTKKGVDQRINVGLTYSLGTGMESRFETFSGAFYYGNANTIVVTDTLNYAKSEGLISLPSKIGIGVNYEISSRASKDLWIIEADYEFYGWNNLAFNGDNQGLENSNQYSFGIQFVPDAVSTTSFFSTLRYRIGGKYKTTRITIEGNVIEDYAGSFGLGVPLFKSKSIYPAASSFDFGVTIGSRGTTDNGLIREQYTNIYIGFSFSPTYWDRWFKKRKIN